MAAGTVTVTVTPAGGSQPMSVMQPYLALNWIIALEGIYPSRN
jgi:microcystin-dependent protein